MSPTPQTADPVNKLSGITDGVVLYRYHGAMHIHCLS